MSISERRKGLRGQQEVQRIVRDAGLTIRKLGGEGDALVDTASGRRLHLETKRQERVRLPEWLRQAAEEAPKGAVPVVVFRQSGGAWYAVLPFDDLVRLVS